LALAWQQQKSQISIFNSSIRLITSFLYIWNYNFSFSEIETFLVHK